MSYTVEVIKDTARPALQRLLAKLTPQRRAAAVGPAVARLLQRHFLGNGRNKRGWPTTNFWARAARATSWSGRDNGDALVSVNQIGVRQRWKGGAIAPVHAKALAIPISPVSYGHLPSEFPGLFLLRTKKGAYLVQYGDGAGRETKAAAAKRVRGLKGNHSRRIKAALNFLFKLSGGVEQQPDDSVMPAMDAILQAAKDALLLAVREAYGQ